MDRPPAVGAVGHDLSHLPSYEAIAEYTRQYQQQAAATVRSFTLQL